MLRFRPTGNTTSHAGRYRFMEVLQMPRTAELLVPFAHGELGAWWLVGSNFLPAQVEDAMLIQQ